MHGITLRIHARRPAGGLRPFNFAPGETIEPKGVLEGPLGEAIKKALLQKVARLF